MRTPFSTTTIHDILTTAPSRLEGIFGDPLVDVELLLEHILKCSRTHLYAHRDQRLTLNQYRRWKRCFERRQAGMPVQYIIGTVLFADHTFKVSPAVLIPRPETEQLVTMVATYALRHNIRNIIEIGAGSGALIISIALTLKPSKKDFHYIGTDVSKKALMIARLNAVRHKLDINFRKRNLLLRPNTFIPLTSWIMVSNPPYVKTADLAEPSIAHEPRLALDGGEDGLDYYDTLLRQISLLQNKPKAIFFEIGNDQAEAVTLLAQKYLEDYEPALTHRDEFGQDRFIEIRHQS